MPGKSKSQTTSISRHALTIVSILLFPLITSYFIYLFDQDVTAYRNLLREDAVIELGTSLLLIITGIISLSLVAPLRKRQHPTLLFVTFLGIAVLIAGIDEISWGQKLVEIRTPEFFLENSDQPEISLHNVAQKTFDIKTRHVVGLLFTAYGIILPILSHSTKLAIFRKIVIPPLSLIPGHFIGINLLRNHATGVEEELGEFLLALALFLTMISFIMNDSSKRDSNPQ